jgi:hypothetical protein
MKNSTHLTTETKQYQRCLKKSSNLLCIKNQITAKEHLSFIKLIYDTAVTFNPFWLSSLEKLLQPVRQGILNANRAIKRAVLLEKLVQQGHTAKKQNVYLPAHCKKTNSLPCSSV